MIQMLSHKYTGLQREEDSWSADFVQSKGEGQIFLLHGPSGVGKTYTAECIAEMTGMYAVIKGSIGFFADASDRPPASIPICC